VTETGKTRRKLLPEMEGAVARRYAKLRGTERQLAQYRQQAAALTTGLRDGAQILEVAPGPGYLAIELARLGFQLTGLDISRTMIEIARERAQHDGVNVDFHQGDVATMAFDPDSFDLVVCQAAFKNFTQPLDALNEIHRVLRPGATAVIQDMRRDASKADIDREVREMELSRPSALMTKLTLTMLRRRAYPPTKFEQLAAESAFNTCQITTEGIGMEIRLTKAINRRPSGPARE
jgi:ubiquinone/menaquinone biosynthesis C-methylase UbiE